MELSPALTKPNTSFVQVGESIGEWFVRIVENGDVTVFQSFGAEERALAYADDQRIRIGLAEIQRLTRDVQINPATWAHDAPRRGYAGSHSAYARCLAA